MRCTERADHDGSNTRWWIVIVQPSRATSTIDGSGTAAVLPPTRLDHQTTGTEAHVDDIASVV